MEEENKFNSTYKFKNELTEIIMKFLDEKLRRLIKCNLEEHDLTGLKQILDIIDKKDSV